MARKKDNWSTIGGYAFLAGLVIAVLAAVYSPIANSGTFALLGVLGLIVGLLNISDKEVMLFLVASIAFMLAATSLGGVLALTPGLGNYIPAVLRNIVVFIAPAAGVVAIKALYDVAKEG